MIESEVKTLLRKGLTDLNLPHDDRLIDSFVLLLEELKKWNKAYNLTGLKNDEDIVVKHFLDSLLYISAFPPGELKVADIGSGAGFPGIPIKMVRPEIEMYLIEPTKKKCAFLSHIIRRLALDGICVIEKRIEDVFLDRELHSRMDIAVTRALFDACDFIKKASRILRPGGMLILNKGPKAKEELKRIEGGYELIDVKLPLSPITRHIIVIKPD